MVSNAFSNRSFENIKTLPQFSQRSLLDITRRCLLVSKIYEFAIGTRLKIVKNAVHAAVRGQSIAAVLQTEFSHAIIFQNQFIEKLEETVKTVPKDMEVCLYFFIFLIEFSLARGAHIRRLLNYSKLVKN